MLNQQSLGIAPTLTIVNGKVKTTSLAVAEHFGKDHKNVLRDIANLGCSEEFNRLNFEPIEYLDGRYRPSRPCK